MIRGWIGILVGLAVLHVAYRLLMAARKGGGSRLASQPKTPLVAAPGVSVIVPAWNDRGVLGRTARALAQAVRAYPGSVQVILVAGGPDDTYVEAVRLANGCSWEVVKQEPRGKNAALNQGVDRARHNVIVFLDADTEVTRPWLGELVAPIAAGRAAATTGRFEAYRKTPVSAVFEAEQEVFQPQPGRTTLFGGGSIALHRSALEAVGGHLPVAVLVGVDFDLSERIRSKGMTIQFATDSCVWTEIAQTWPEYWRGEVRWRRAYLDAQLRHLLESGRLHRLIGLVYLPLVQALLLTGWLLFPLLFHAFHGAPIIGLAVWSIFAFWILGRHAATCVEAYARTRERRWIAILPTYLLAFAVSALASWSALISFRRVNPHFKGRRGMEGS